MSNKKIDYWDDGLLKKELKRLGSKLSKKAARELLDGICFGGEDYAKAACYCMSYSDLDYDIARLQAQLADRYGDREIKRKELENFVLSNVEHDQHIAWRSFGFRLHEGYDPNCELY